MCHQHIEHNIEDFQYNQENTSRRIKKNVESKTDTSKKNYEILKERFVVVNAMFCKALGNNDSTRFPLTICELTCILGKGDVVISC